MSGADGPGPRDADERELPGWTPRPTPPRVTLPGRYCRVVPLDADEHAADLHAANSADREGRMWRYLSCGPFDSQAAYLSWIAEQQRSPDPLFFAIVEATAGRAVGVASFMRIEPAHGTIEIGNLAYSPALQRTRAATEAMYLMIRAVFDLGYRRCEWKCNAGNEASRAAALRLGFVFEGVFRQHWVVKGRNRDTAWYSMLDREWPTVRTGFERWLDPANFDPQGQQRTSLLSARQRGPEGPPLKT